MRFRSDSGVPVPWMVFHRASLSTESKGDLRSTYASIMAGITGNEDPSEYGWAKTAMEVDRPGVNPDCCGLFLLMRRA